MAGIVIDGVELEYRLIPGPADAPTVILLHEGLGCVALWRTFPDKLARLLNLRTLVYSRRGYGLSAPLSGPRHPRFMHAEALVVLPALREALGIRDALLVGHSDGASIALIHAADGGHVVRGLVLMAPHIVVEDITVDAIAKVTRAYATTDLRERLARHHAHVDDAFMGWSNIWLAPEFRSWTLEQDVRRLQVPTLVIQGREDEYGTLAQIEGIAAHAPGSIQTLVLDACGHSPHRDQEDAVLHAIAGFVARVL